MVGGGAAVVLIVACDLIAFQKKITIKCDESDARISSFTNILSKFVYCANILPFNFILTRSNCIIYIIHMEKKDRRCCHIIMNGNNGI